MNDIFYKMEFKCSSSQQCSVVKWISSSWLREDKALMNRKDGRKAEGGRKEEESDVI
jgi:hypothetical protein